MGRKVTALHLAKHKGIICGFCQGEPGDHRWVGKELRCTNELDDGTLLSRDDPHVPIYPAWRTDSRATSARGKGTP